MIPGNQSTPYAGGIFALDVCFPVGHPRAPPQLKIITKTLHPNVSETGSISGLRILDKHDWSPIVTPELVLLDLETLLGEPGLEEAAEPMSTVSYLEKQSRI
jgi:ubiquitin-protein ligase